LLGLFRIANPCRSVRLRLAPPYTKKIAAIERLRRFFLPGANSRAHCTLSWSRQCGSCRALRTLAWKTHLHRGKKARRPGLLAVQSDRASPGASHERVRCACGREAAARQPSWPSDSFHSQHPVRPQPSAVFKVSHCATTGDPPLTSRFCAGGPTRPAPHLQAGMQLPKGLCPSPSRQYGSPLGQTNNQN